MRPPPVSLYRMKTCLHPAWINVSRPVFGMVHLAALPGSPRFGGRLAAVREALLHDAEALVAGGVHALMLENFGDVPFHPRRVPPYVIAHMAVLAAEVRRRFEVPLGINVLRNDGRSALGIAHAVGAAFIRVNVLSGARVTDQGVLDGIAHDLLRERTALQADDIKILADVNVKHAAPLGQPRPIEDELADAVERGCADAVVLSGSGTGKPTDLTEVRRAHAAAGDTPVLIGSGVSADTIADYLPFADGFIVGSSLKLGGLAANPVDATRVRALLARLKPA